MGIDRKSVIVIQYVTLDGVVQDPDGRGGTAFGGWAMRHGPEAIAGDKFRLGPILTTGVLLFGHRTWDHFRSFWPARTTEFADAMNAADKAVLASSPVDPTGWSHSRVVDLPLPEWIARETAERDVVVIGSGSVVDALARADLVDEYRLITFPTVAGAGRRLFDRPAQLRLLSSEQVGQGVLSSYSTRG